ncbi:hypothetical protein [uncultured Roseibium sp.]|uniref:hypothetical protein n=1 Tax=uncultured Roseibium sp. TaxID=1936171 RepID=UPI003217FBF7
MFNRFISTFLLSIFFSFSAFGSEKFQESDFTKVSNLDFRSIETLFMLQEKREQSRVRFEEFIVKVATEDKEKSVWLTKQLLEYKDMREFSNSIQEKYGYNLPPWPSEWKDAASEAYRLKSDVQFSQQALNDETAKMGKFISSEELKWVEDILVRFTYKEWRKFTELAEMNPSLRNLALNKKEIKNKDEVRNAIENCAKIKNVEYSCNFAIDNYFQENDKLNKIIAMNSLYAGLFISKAEPGLAQTRKLITDLIPETKAENRDNDAFENVESMIMANFALEDIIKDAVNDKNYEEFVRKISLIMKNPVHNFGKRIALELIYQKLQDKTFDSESLKELEGALVLMASDMNKTLENRDYTGRFFEELEPKLADLKPARIPYYANPDHARLRFKEGGGYDFKAILSGANYWDSVRDKKKDNENRNRRSTFDDYIRDAGNDSRVSYYFRNTEAIEKERARKLALQALIEKKKAQRREAISAGLSKKYNTPWPTDNDFDKQIAYIKEGKIEKTNHVFDIQQAMHYILFMRAFSEICMDEHHGLAATKTTTVDVGAGWSISNTQIGRNDILTTYNHKYREEEVVSVRLPYEDEWIYDGVQGYSSAIFQRNIKEGYVYPGVGGGVLQGFAAFALIQKSIVGKHRRHLRGIGCSSEEASRFYENVQILGLILTTSDH